MICKLFRIIRIYFQRSYNRRIAAKKFAVPQR